MLAPRIAATALAAGALVAVAGPAFAGVEVNPNPVAPGGTVTVNDGLGARLCPDADKAATASSNGFAGGSITLTRGTQTLIGSGTAVSTPGTYQVSITCAGGTSSGPNTYNLVVSPQGPAATGDGASIMGSANGEFTALVTLVGAAGLGVIAWRRHRSGTKG